MAARTGKRTRNVLAFGASLILNAALLVSMAFGVREFASPPETEAVQLVLMPPLIARLRPPANAPTSSAPSSSAPAAKAPAAQRPIAPPLKVLTRPPQTPAPGVASGSAPVPAQIAEPPGPHINMGPGDGVEDMLKESVGCDDPDAYHLTKAQRAACVDRLTAHAKTAPNLFGLKMPPDKLAAFDRYVRCHAQNRGGSLPALDDNEGLGEVQRLRDCGPGDR